MPRQHLVRVDADLYRELERIKREEGVPIAESLRRAVRLYLQSKGRIPPPRPPAAKG